MLTFSSRWMLTGTCSQVIQSLRSKTCDYTIKFVRCDAALPRVKWLLGLQNWFVASCTLYYT